MGPLFVCHCSSHRNGWLPMSDAYGIFHWPMRFSHGWPLDLWSLRHFEEPMSSPGALLRCIPSHRKLESAYLGEHFAQGGVDVYHVAQLGECYVTVHQGGYFLYHVGCMGA